MKKVIVFAMALVAASTLFARGPVHRGPIPPPIYSSHHHHHHHHGSGGAIAAGIVGGALLGGLVARLAVRSSADLSQVRYRRLRLRQ